ncbi:MAG: M23 family metallopeptidase [Spirochaetaceae bacterium]|nr:M23 family metallopeptidase [Spirochaetaceae bacterium]
MKLNKITEELSLYRIIAIFFSLSVLGVVYFSFPSENASVDTIFESSIEPIEKIEIIKMPFISKIQENFSTVKAELLYGSNLNDMLISNGINRDDAASVVYEISPFVNLRNLKAGEVFELNYTNNEFTSLTMNNSKNKIITVVRNLNTESGFIATENERQLQTFIKQVSGIIEGSLYNSALDAGMSSNILMELIMLLSYDVDFQRDIQAGDTFTVAYEVIYDSNGEIVDDGNILSAKLVTDGREIEFFYYTDLNGKTDYFNNQGQTIRKTLLKTPINGAYITSAYGMRISPITGYSKKHTGIDFGAPRGTPIYASGDGIIESAYYSQVYGNFIELRHVNGFRTLYGHMTNYARGMRPGIRVKQGQIIGYVGSTGMSTGPHLHYEVSYWGTKVNPTTVKSPPGRVLKEEDLILFNNLKKSYIASFQ